MRSRTTILSLVSTVLAVAVGTLTSTSAQASSKCDLINRVYTQCGNDFAYDGKSFFFKIAGQTRRVDCNDGRQLDYFDRLDQMDIESILSIPYTMGKTTLPENRKNFDPGRLRNDDLLKATFGADEASVRANLVKIPFLGHTI
ncbi:MAG: hypothetical protein V4692_15985, partial [Bdellovibrionota bacterium]